MYLKNLYNELRIWKIVKSVAKSNEKLLNENGFRVDWVGRIYTVINLPEEVVNAPVSREGYVLMKLREYEDMFLKLGISDVIFPEMMPIEGEFAYLLIVSPNRTYFSVWEMTKFLFRLSLIGLGCRIAYLLINPHTTEIISFFKRIFDYVF